MYTAHFHGEQLHSLFAQGARLLDGLCIEIDMGVVALDRLHVYLF